MGPLRRGLILSFIMMFTAVPAVAEVCDKMRPDWNPADGPAGAFGEAITLLTSPWALLTIAFIVAAYFLRQAILAHAAIALATSLMVVLAVIPLLIASPILEAARTEGCVGPGYLRFFVGALILAAAIFVMKREWNNEQQGE